MCLTFESRATGVFFARIGGKRIFKVMSAHVTSSTTYGPSFTLPFAPGSLGGQPFSSDGTDGQVRRLLKQVGAGPSPNRKALHNIT